MIIKRHPEGLFSCAAVATGLLLCASCGDSGTTTDDSAGASAGTTSTGGDSTGEADMGEPPAQTPDCEGNVYVGRRIDAGTCGDLEGYQGRWVGTSLGSEGVLASFCEYRWTPNGQADPDLTALPGPVDGVESLAELCLRVIPQGDYFAADVTLRTKIFDEFMANIGKPPAPMPGGPGLAPVDLRLIDTMPDGLLEKGLLPRSQHGLTLHNLGRSILCVDGDCRADVYDHLGLPRINEQEEDRYRGGFFGNFVDLARGINEGVEQWEEGNANARLILVLALGWEGLDDYGLAPLQGKSVQEIVSDPGAPADLQFVLASLARASCRGALSVAAAGNSNAEPCVQSGPTGPGFLEAIPAPDAAMCEALGFDHADASWLGERPLVLAATHVTADGGAHANARPGAQAPLAAQGAAFGSADDSSAMLLGSSVAALTVGATAAWVWSYFPELTPAEVRDILHGSGTGLGTLAQFPNPEESRQVSISSALHAACLASGGNCADFPGWAGPPGPDPTITARVQSLLDAPMLNTLVLGPDFPSSGQSPSACGGEMTVWPQTDIPPLPPQPPYPWTSPQPGQSACPTCPVGVISGGKGIKVGLAFVTMMPFVGPIFIDVQTSTGPQRVAVPVEKLMGNPVDVVDIVPPGDWGEIRQVSLGYVLEGLDGSRTFYSEPLLSYPYCEGAPPTCYAPLCVPGAKEACTYVGDNEIKAKQEKKIGLCIGGERVCAGDGQSWGPCEGMYPPQGQPTPDEICNDNLDNNCDSQIDEGCQCGPNDPPKECYPSNPKDLEAPNGICAPGEQTCIGGSWGTCEGFVKPEVEQCGTAADEDCDGKSGCCGDGVVMPGEEECDDGDLNGVRACSVECKKREALQVVMGRFHACALLTGGKVKCWGANQYGELGLGDTEPRGDEAGEMGDKLSEVDLGTNTFAIALASGAHHTCASLDDGTVKCWGYGGLGPLGLGNALHRGDNPNEMGDNLPAVDLGVKEPVVEVTGGRHQTCALFESGPFKCWGYNGYGQLGLGDTVSRGDDPGEMGEALPFVELGKGGDDAKISTGWYNCALFQNGLVKCWGSNANGGLGLGDLAHRGDQAGEMGDSLPFVDLGADVVVMSLDTGWDHSCALLTDGRVKCWGCNDNGQLGLGSKTHMGDNPGEMGDVLPSVDLGADYEPISVIAGADSSCALLKGGLVKCWGHNGNGHLGLGDTNNRGDEFGEMGDALPLVDLGEPVKALAHGAGFLFHCALLESGSVKCWGENLYGQLGLGDTQNRGDQPGEMGENLPRVKLFSDEW